MTLTLGVANFGEPVLWAVLIGWVMSVTLHEFAHGVVGYFGGDYTIRDRGGLTLNPLQYVDPMMSIVLPIIFLLMGGIPLPGGATYIRRDLIKSRAWDSAVSAAGPAMNFALYAVLAYLMSPSFGWIEPGTPAAAWTTAQKFVGTMCFLQLLSVILNLIPVPTLDGFGIIAPYLPADLRERLMAPQTRSTFLFGYFMVLSFAPGVMQAIQQFMFHVMGRDLFVRCALAMSESGLFR